MSTTKTAIVTGASQGIGAGIVNRFLEKGYNSQLNMQDKVSALTLSLPES